MVANFRGIDAAASLKLLGPHRGCPCMCHFRGIDAAASLKRYFLYISCTAVSHFRGIDAAASLKPGCRRSDAQCSLEFPRHRCRGLIEAW